MLSGTQNYMSATSMPRAKGHKSNSQSKEILLLMSNSFVGKGQYLLYNSFLTSLISKISSGDHAILMQWLSLHAYLSACDSLVSLYSHIVINHKSTCLLSILILSLCLFHINLHLILVRLLKQCMESTNALSYFLLNNNSVVCLHE